MFFKTSYRFLLASMIVISPLKAQDTKEVHKFDVAGLSLGMTAAQASRVLEGSGYKPIAYTSDLQPSWHSRISEAAAKRGTSAKSKRVMVPCGLSLRGPQGEEIRVQYAATPQGAILASVAYRIPEDRMPSDSFDAAVLKKYGSPGARNPIWYYCSGGTYCGGFSGTWNKYPHLRAFNNNLTLKFGSDFEKDLDAQFQKDLEAAAPRDAKASF